MMAYEFDLRRMTRHLTDILDRDKEVIVTDDTEFAFQKVIYGEPSQILEWPLLSVMPINKSRELKTTRKYEVIFEIHLILYHGEITTTGEIQEGTHKRAEALEYYIMSDRTWNFIDLNDPTKQKVIHGYVANLDHPNVFMGTDALWSASRLNLQALSEENFHGES